MFEEFKTMTEVELRDAKVPTLESEEQLTAFIGVLVDREQVYGTCVYAMSMASVAAFNYVASKLGVTGFQASCADMDILKRLRHMEHGFKIIDYANLFYPQYMDTIPGAWGIVSENKEYFKKEAQKLLDKGDANVHANVKEHWKKLASVGEKEGKTNGS